jgi:hypothetical protein
MDFDDKAKELNQRFGLTYLGQDWAHVNADPKKLNSFTDYYLQTSDQQEMSMVFDLIINSIQGLEDRSELQLYMNRINTKVAQNFSLHSFYIKFYAQLGELEDEDGMFPYTDYFRDWIESNTRLSVLTIKSNRTSEVLIDGKSINKWINRKPIPIKFQSIISYLKRTCLSTEPNDNYLNYSDEQKISDKRRITTDFIYIKKGIHKEFTFVELFAMNEENHLLKFRSKNIAEEINKF